MTTQTTPSDTAPTGLAPSPDRAVEAVRVLARVSRLLERSSPDLNLAHYRVLSAVASGDQRASRVAARLVLGKPAVSAAVDSLCERGLLVRTGVTDDQRATALALTPAGTATLAEIEAEMIARLHKLCARTPDPDRLLESLAWLGAALDDAMVEHAAARKADAEHAAARKADAEHAAARKATR